MPIQPIDFEPLTFDQANPFLTGVQRGEQLVGGGLENQQRALANALAKAQLPYAAPSAQAQLQAQQLANALKQNDLNYAPQMSQADLAYKQAQTPYLRAQTGLVDQQSKYYPFDELIKAQAANQSSSRFGQAYQLRQTLLAMPAPTRAAWIAENQDAYNQMTADLANGQGKQQSLITPAILEQYFPGASQQQPDSTGNNLQQVLQQTGSSPVPNYLTRTGQSIQTQQPIVKPGAFAQPTQELNDLTRKASIMAANKDLTTAATRRQVEGAIQVEGIVNDPRIQQQVVNAAQYAGAAGKGQAALDALSQTNPQAYEDYRSLRYQTMPLLQNRIKTLDQMGGTDKQREELQGLYDKAMDSMTSNPEQFITQFNALTKTLDTIAKAAQTSANPIFDVNRLQGNQQIPQPGMQQALAPAVAPTTGVTVNMGGKTYIKKGDSWELQ